MKHIKIPKKTIKLQDNKHKSNIKHNIRPQKLKLMCKGWCIQQNDQND